MTTDCVSTAPRRAARALLLAAVLSATGACASSGTATSPPLATVGAPATSEATTAVPITTAAPTTVAPTAASTTTTTTAPAPTSAPATVAAPAGLPVVDAAAYGVYDLNSNRWLGEHAVDEQRPIASLIKLLTALVVLQTGDLDRVVTVPEMQLADDESRIWLYPGQQLTRRELFDAMLVASANDAAIALAIDNAGSVDAFVQRMNGAAATAGLTATRAGSPVGLDSAGGVSSARDLATLTALLWQSPEFRAAVSKPAIEMFGQSFPNTNDLLATYPGANGVKTGSTTAAGRCLVVSAERDGRTIVAVALGSPTDEARFTAGAQLLDWGFAQP
ncbi:MAG TPA: serine hydrolase [Ilumatobacteraceae bacterium]